MDFEQAYDENLERVYGFFAYRVSSRADAEDLTQGTFERALRAWSKFDPTRASAGTWLLAIARNHLIDRYRADAGTSRIPLDQLDPDLLVGDQDIKAGLGLDPDLQNALAKLSERDREILALRFGGDLTGLEIASLTGLTVANVQQILSRSLRRLRETLEAPPEPTQLSAVAQNQRMV